MWRLKCSLLAVIVTIMALFTGSQAFVNTFGLFNKDDFLLSAPIKGVLLDNGVPVVNTKVIRSLTYGDEYIDETITNDDGFFAFDEKRIHTSKKSNIFDNDALIQHVYLENGTPEGIVLWYAGISIYENSETLRELLNGLRCDVAKKPHTYDVPIKEALDHYFTIYGACEL